MKSIFNPPEIQFSGTNARIKWINDKMKPFMSRPILILLIPWVVYPLLDIVSTYHFELDSMGMPFAILTTLFGFCCSCIYFFWLFPAIFYSNNLLILAMLSLIGIAILSGMKYVIFQLVGIVPQPPWDFASYELMRQLVFLSITFAVWGFYALIRALQEKQRTEISLDKLKIVHNKGQLSSHFTLNLIGDISAKSLKYSPELFEDLNQFITILRYAYIDNEKFNSLSAETLAMLSYLHGQRLRFGDSIFIQENIDRELINFEELYIPKLLLITLLENVFKHGIYTDPDNPVYLEAELLHGKNGIPVFCFSTKNKINKATRLPKTGFGIETVRNLLDYFFDNAELKTNVNQDIYSLNLTIPYEKPNQTWPDR